MICRRNDVVSFEMIDSMGKVIQIGLFLPLFNYIMCFFHSLQSQSYSSDDCYLHFVVLSWISYAIFTGSYQTTNDIEHFFAAMIDR